MEFPFTLPRRHMTALAWILRKTCGNLNKICAAGELRAYASRFAGGCSIQSSAAAMRREIDGCEWKNHSTTFEGLRSARFCSASLFIEEMKGSMLVIDRKA